MRILVLGDSYCPAAALEHAFGSLSGHELTFRDVRDEPDWQPSTPSELRIREFLGSPAQVIAALDGHEVLVVQGAPVTDAVLAADPGLRLICVARGGPVNVDVATATAAGIPVVTTPGKNATAVAELTIACMVMLARHIPDVLRHADAGGELFVDNYEGARWFGHDLAHMTLGLVGFGAIGSRVARRALAFEMRILVSDSFVSPDAVRAAGCEPVALDELLARSDVVSLHARATADNQGLLGRERLARMRAGSWLINTARDTLVDEAALDDALRTGHIAGAALDIASPSSSGTRHRLLAHPNVVLMPHIGGATAETLANGGLMAAAEIERFAAGEPLSNLANRDVLRVGRATVSHVLAIDLGTGSCRAIVFDLAGAQVGVGQREWRHASIPGVPGSQVFDTEHGWQLVCDCIGDALTAAGLTGRDIAAVSSTSMREGMVLYDEAGQELWACPNVNSRAGAQATELVRSGGARQIFERGGDWVSITSPARFLWIREHEPEIFKAMAHVGMLSDWVLTRLTGRFTTDPSCGSSSDLFDLAQRDWSGETLGLIGVPREVMPEVLESGSVMGEVTDAAARRTGLAAGTPVVVGGGDTQLGLVGIGGTRPGQLTLLGGTFWQLTVVTDQPLIDPQARVRTLCHAVPGQWMTEGIAFYGGMSMRWLRDALCDPERAEAARRGIDAYVVMEEAAAAVPAGSNGLLAIFSNVMDVKRWVQAPPSFVGFDVGDPSRTDRRACIRAVEEQAAFASRGHLAIIEELTGQPVDSIVFTGGAAKGQLWPRIVAGALGVTVHVPEVKESTALGAAMLAGVGVGLHPDLDTVARATARFERTIEPDPADRAAYDDAFGRWSAVYPRLLALAEDGLAAPMWWPAGA